MLQKKKRPVLENFSYSFGLQFFKIAAPMVVMPFVYRQIEPYAMGQVNLVVALMTYFYIAGDLGLYIYGIREVSLIKYDKNALSKFFTEVFVFRLITNSIALVAFYLYIYYFAGGNIPKSFYYISAIQVISNFFNVEWIFEATENYRFIAIKTVIIRLITMVATFIMVRGHNASQNYLLLLVLFMLVNNIFTFTLLKNEVSWYRGKLSLFIHFKSMIFIFVMINWTMLYYQLDKLIMGNNNDIISVGYYTLSERISVLISSFLFSFIMVVTPRLGERLSLGGEYYSNFLKKILKVIFVFIFPCSFLTFSVTHEILYIFGGSKYLAAEGIFKVFVFYIIIYILMESMKTHIMLLNKKERVYFICVIVGGAANIILKGVFGHLMNGFMIILTTLIIAACIIIFLSFYSKKKLNIVFLNKDALKYLLISLPLLGLDFIHLKSIIISLLVKGILATIYYAGVLILTKDDILELDALKSLKLNRKTTVQ